MVMQTFESDRKVLAGMEGGGSKTWWMRRTQMEQILLIACGLSLIVNVGLLIGVAHLHHTVTTINLCPIAAVTTIPPALNCTWNIDAAGQFAVDIVDGNTNELLVCTPGGAYNVTGPLNFSLFPSFSTPPSMLFNTTDAACTTPVTLGTSCMDPLVCPCQQGTTCCPNDNSVLNPLVCLKADFQPCTMGVECCSNNCYNSTYCCANLGKPAPAPEFCCPGHVWSSGDMRCLSNRGQYCYTSDQCAQPLVCQGATPGQQPGKCQ